MTRAVSTVVSYVLALAITATLISGLLLATGELVDGRQETTAQAGLEVSGERLAAAVMAADRLAATGPNAAAVEVALPRQVAGSTYTVTVDTAPGATIYLESGATDTNVSVSVATRTDIAETTARGGDLEVVFSGGALEVRLA
jgi:hypothetical protein